MMEKKIANIIRFNRRTMSRYDSFEEWAKIYLKRNDKRELFEQAFDQVMNEKFLQNNERN